MVKCGICLEKRRETDTVFATELHARLQGHWDVRPVHPDEPQDSQFDTTGFAEYDEKIADWHYDLQSILEERFELT